MIQQELWQAQLATAARTDINTSAHLWKLYCQLLGQLLSKGESVYQARLGTWQASLQSEYIGLDEAGKRCLHPPRVLLKLQWQPSSEQGPETLLQALGELAPYTPSVVSQWWEAIPTLLFDLLERGRAVHWEQIGQFTKEESSEGTDCYRFTPEGELSELLNRPFSMFPSVELDDEASLPDTPFHPEPQPIHSVWTSQPATVEPEAPTPEALSEAEEAILPIADESEASIIPPAKATDSAVEESTASSTHEPIEESGENKSTEEAASESEVQSYLVADNGIRKNSGKRMLLGMIGTVMVILFGLGIYIFINSNEQAQLAKQAQQQELAKQQAQAREQQRRDSLAAIEAKLLEPIGTASIERGTTLARLALTNYGHRAFWVYIYEENKSQIKDPNNVPLGTVVTLPAPAKYGIDASDSAALRQAIDLQWQILK